MISHPYIKYALALLLEEYNLSNVSEITDKELRLELTNCTNSFSLKPSSNYEGKKTVRFIYSPEENKVTECRYLAPNIISSEIKANNIYKNLQNINRIKKGDLSLSLLPIAGEYLSFGNSIGRGKPQASVMEQKLALITSTTRKKPCLQLNTEKEKENVCLIPDLEISKLVDFIRLFKRMSVIGLDSDIMNGNASGNKTDRPQRPKIYQGNFPNAPKNSLYCGISLLGAIGEMTKQADVSELANNVLESLKGKYFYIIKYGNADNFSFNHHIIDLASESKLKQIIDSIYWASLFKCGGNRKECSDKDEFKKYDFFANRFLTLFNHPTFKDFLAFRAEYPTELNLLLIKYFEKMENIDIKIVQSAKALGQWLNQTAYIAAIKDNPDCKVKDNERKYKYLIELESSIFSAKTGDALIAHTITRAGRLSNTDAPEAAVLFLEKTATGELQLDKAKNLLIAFSRVFSSKSHQDGKGQGLETKDETENNSENTKDLSNI